MILHRDLKLENVLLTEAPRAKERKIYPPARAAPEAAATGSNKAEAAAVSPKEEGEKGKEARTPRPEAKLADFGLAENILKAVLESGYTVPTPIQREAIPHILMGGDVTGIAQTGTGKTAAFVLPMIQRLSTGRARARMPRCLILCPTA